MTKHNSQEELNEVGISSIIYLLDPSTEFSYKQIKVESLLINFTKEGSEVIEINGKKVYNDFQYFKDEESVKAYLISNEVASQKRRLKRLRDEHKARIEKINN